jgi:hypothetical protein
MVSLVRFAGAEREKAKAPPGDAGLSWGGTRTWAKPSSSGRPGSEKVQEEHRWPACKVKAGLRSRASVAAASEMDASVVEGQQEDREREDQDHEQRAHAVLPFIGQLLPESVRSRNSYCAHGDSLSAPAAHLELRHAGINLNSGKARPSTSSHRRHLSVSSP